MSVGILIVMATVNTNRSTFSKQSDTNSPVLQQNCQVSEDAS